MHLHGRPPRLQHHDYAAPGMYFITLCTQGRSRIFGEIVGRCVRLSEWGQIVQEEWLKTPILRPYVRLDAWVIMPDHLHGIVVWDRDPFEVVGRLPRSLGSFVARFKAICTKRINEVRMTDQPRIWQRNYYEHIIRNQRALDRIRRYILENPHRWTIG